MFETNESLQLLQMLEVQIKQCDRAAKRMKKENSTDPKNKEYIERFEQAAKTARSSKQKIVASLAAKGVFV